MTMRTHRWAALAVAIVLAGCGGSDGASDTTTVDTTADTTAAPATEPPATEPPATEPPATEPPATEAPAEPVNILVTNDDGVAAEGIDAIVTGLLTLEDVVVTVVAPAENQSGSGGKTTDGDLSVAATTTASGYPAMAVTGFPADTIVWAIDQGGVDIVPDLVVSGVNEGQNIGPLIDLSGTVGAARAAAARNIPAIAVSAGIGNETVPENYEAAVDAVLAWLTENISDIASREEGTPVPNVWSFNVPTCVNGGEVRGLVEVEHASDLGTVDVITGVDCTGDTTRTPANDVEAFLDGYIALSPTPITPAG